MIRNTILSLKGNPKEMYACVSFHVTFVMLQTHNLVMYWTAKSFQTPRD